MHLGRVTLLVAACALLASLVASAAMGFDKGRARRGRRRVPERAFWLLALAGGGPGVLAGMLAFRHKTRKPRFWVPAAAATLLWAVLAFAWARHP